MLPTEVCGRAQAEKKLQGHRHRAASAIDKIANCDHIRCATAIIYINKTLAVQCYRDQQRRVLKRPEAVRHAAGDPQQLPGLHHSGLPANSYFHLPLEALHRLVAAHMMGWHAFVRWYHQSHDFQIPGFTKRKALRLLQPTRQGMNVNHLAWKMAHESAQALYDLDNANFDKAKTDLQRDVLDKLADEASATLTMLNQQ